MIRFNGHCSSSALCFFLITLFLSWLYPTPAQEPIELLFAACSDDVHLTSSYHPSLSRHLPCLLPFVDVYTLPCDHAGGTFWYHPHHHGSIALQIGGGAMGALIVEDRPDVHGIPDQYADMPEIIVTVQVRFAFFFCSILMSNSILWL